jgi:hypothetical protein
VNSRVSVVTGYLYNGSLYSTENYYYDSNGKLTSHTVKDSSNAVIKAFNYQYDTNDRVSRLDYMVSGSLNEYVLYTYNADNRISHADIYNSSGTKIYYTDFTYSVDGKITRKDFHQEGISQGAWMLFDGYGEGLYTKQDFYNSSGALINRITQVFDSNICMASRHFYNGSLVLQDYVIFNAGTDAKKTGLSYYDGSGSLMLTAVYTYEPGSMNIDENHADMFEMVYLDTGIY